MFYIIGVLFFVACGLVKLAIGTLMWIRSSWVVTGASDFKLAFLSGVREASAIMNQHEGIIVAAIWSVFIALYFWSKFESSKVTA